MLGGLLSLAAHAATGPFPVGWQDRQFEDPQAGTVAIRVFYPAITEGEGALADPASGPFPLAGFLHGWLGSAWMYDEVCSELASHGYVVGSLDTETGLILDMEAFADDAVAMLHALEARSDLPEDPLAGMVSDDDWTALGHSMGGATLGRLLGLEPRIRTAVAFMPYEGEPAYYEALRAYDGALLVLSGTHDTTAPPALQAEWMDAADLTSRGLLVELTDVGHTAVTDLTFGDDPIPDDLQRPVVIALGTTFVRAEQGGDESLWAELIGPVSTSIERTVSSRSHDPALWAELVDDEVTLGVAGLIGSTGEVFFGASEDLLDVAVGTVDLATSGVAETTVDAASWSGDLYVAVRIDGEIWTRAVALVTGNDQPEDEPPVGDEPPVDDEPAADRPSPAASEGCGCANGPQSIVRPAPLVQFASPWLVLLVALGRRRR